MLAKIILISSGSRIRVKKWNGPSLRDSCNMIPSANARCWQNADMVLVNMSFGVFMHGMKVTKWYLPRSWLEQANAKAKTNAASKFLTQILTLTPLSTSTDYTQDQGLALIAFMITQDISQDASNFCFCLKITTPKQIQDALIQHQQKRTKELMQRKSN